MRASQKSLCVFSHYSQYKYIPKYVCIYIDELSRYFDEIILVTNQRTLTNGCDHSSQNVSTLFVKNEGYDLGMFYKAIQTIDIAEYNQIACINDSNILINELSPVVEWSKKTPCDFWGIIDSSEKPWFSVHQNNYHIQSHFLVFNSKAIEKLPAFFAQLNIQDIFEEINSVKLRRKVIKDWEIGITQYLIKQDLISASYIDSRSFSLLYSSGKPMNVGHKLYAELIQSGYPLIKRKVITKSNWKDRFRRSENWEKLVRQYGNRNWDIEAMIEELVKQNL